MPSSGPFHELQAKRRIQRLNISLDFDLVVSKVKSRSPPWCSREPPGSGWEPASPEGKMIQRPTLHHLLIRSISPSREHLARTAF
jgi:hypothetical protein